MRIYKAYGNDGNICNPIEEFGIFSSLKAAKREALNGNKDEDMDSIHVWTMELKDDKYEMVEKWKMDFSEGDSEWKKVYSSLEQSPFSDFERGDNFEFVALQNLYLLPEQETVYMTKDKRYTGEIIPNGYSQNNLIRFIDDLGSGHTMHFDFAEDKIEIVKESVNDKVVVEKERTIKLIGYEIEGEVSVNMWGGGEATLVMAPIRIFHPEKSIEEIKEIIPQGLNDNQYGVESFNSATVDIYELYEGGFTELKDECVEFKDVNFGCGFFEEGINAKLMP
jgi:hypothetical protein